MKVVIQCSQCERKNIVEEERLKNPDEKRLRCGRCGAFYDEAAIKEALSDSSQGQH